jgi:hypothetical protein
MLACFLGDGAIVIYQAWIYNIHNIPKLEILLWGKGVQGMSYEREHEDELQSWKLSLLNVSESSWGSA